MSGVAAGAVPSVPSPVEVGVGPELAPVVVAPPDETGTATPGGPPSNWIRSTSTPVSSPGDDESRGAPAARATAAPSQRDTASGRRAWASAIEPERRTGTSAPSSCTSPVRQVSGTAWGSGPTVTG